MSKNELVIIFSIPFLIMTIILSTIIYYFGFSFWTSFLLVESIVFDFIILRHFNFKK
jgi:hypothetical protein